MIEAVFAYYYFAERKGYVLFFAYFYTFKASTRREAQQRVASIDLTHHAMEYE